MQSMRNAAVMLRSGLPGGNAAKRCSQMPEKYLFFDQVLTEIAK